MCRNLLHCVHSLGFIQPWMQLSLYDMICRIVSSHLRIHIIPRFRMQPNIGFTQRLKFADVSLTSYILSVSCTRASIASCCDPIDSMSTAKNVTIRPVKVAAILWSFAAGIISPICARTSQEVPKSHALRGGWTPSNWASTRSFWILANGGEVSCSPRPHARKAVMCVG